MKKIVLWTVLVAILLVSALILFKRAKQPSANTETTISYDQQRLRGVSWSPKSSSVADLNAFFKLIPSIGNALSWAGNYQDLAKTTGNAARTVIEQSRKYNITPIIITGPNNNEVLDGIGQENFRNAVLNFIKENDVPYIGLGNEIDEIYLKSPTRYENLIRIIEQLATDVRAASPDTKVFTIFQLERVKGMRGGLFGGKNDPSINSWPLIAEIKNLDFVAFTSYPCLIYKSPAEIPDEYYSEIANHTSLPVIFTEIGWFRETPTTGWESSEAEQAQFVQQFKQLTERIAPSIVIWPFLYDQDIATPFKQIGLLGQESTTSLGYEAWKNY
jgi:hypothetical protein